MSRHTAMEQPLYRNVQWFRSGHIFSLRRKDLLNPVTRVKKRRRRHRTATRCDAMLHNAVQYSQVNYGKVYYSTVHYSTVQCSTTHPVKSNYVAASTDHVFGAPRPSATAEDAEPDWSNTLMGYSRKAFVVCRVDGPTNSGDTSPYRMTRVTLHSLGMQPRV